MDEFVMCETCDELIRESEAKRNDGVCDICLKEMKKFIMNGERPDITSQST